MSDYNMTGDRPSSAGSKMRDEMPNNDLGQSSALHVPDWASRRRSLDPIILGIPVSSMKRDTSLPDVSFCIPSPNKLRLDSLNSPRAFPALSDPRSHSHNSPILSAAAPFLQQCAGADIQALSPRAQRRVLPGITAVSDLPAASTQALGIGLPRDDQQPLRGDLTHIHATSPGLLQHELTSPKPRLPLPPPLLRSGDHIMDTREDTDGKLPHSATGDLSGGDFFVFPPVIEDME